MNPEDETDSQAEAPTDVRSLLDAAVTAQENPPDAATTAAEEPARETRTRGADGKFARAETTETVATETTVATPAAEAKPAPTEPPATWTEAQKATFRKLDPEGQKFLTERHAEMQADYTRKTTTLAALDRDYRPVADMLAPHDAELRSKGYTPATLIKAWMDAETQLANPAAAPALIRTLVDNYKIDRGAVARALGLTTPAPAAGMEQPATPTGTDPIVLPPELAAKLNGFDEFIAQQTRQQQERQAQEQRETTNRVMSTIDSFKEAKDDKGALLHPLFADVEGQMTALALAARTRGEAIPPLDELYDQAVWATPATRAKQLEATSAADEARRTAAEAERQKQIRAKAEQARRAGSSVTGSPGTGQTPAQAQKGGGSVRDSLLAAVEEHETV